MLLVNIVPTVAFVFAFWHLRSSSLSDGITSIVSSADGSRAVAGSKRGALYEVCVTSNRSGMFCEAKEIKINNDAGNRRTFPLRLPVYSLSFVDESCLLCGGGDRHVTVLEHSDSHGWIQKQRLGPHTGWVRDVLVLDNQQVLSIGCNFIEGWKATAGHWSNIGRVSINSLAGGEAATLSSDLLCLCRINGNYFVAGGVDGRIHLWNSSQFGSEAPVQSFTAHEGRINALEVDERNSLLLSASHDGVVRCWKWSHEREELDAEGSIDIRLDCRVTALRLLHSLKGFVNVAAGSSDGLLANIVLREAANKSWTMHLESSTEIDSKPMIYAIEKIRAIESSDDLLLVGQSYGMTVVELK